MIIKRAANRATVVSILALFAALASAQETHHGIEDGDHGNENLIRLGVEYGFHRNGWEISPQLDLDIVDRETEVWVLGVVFARGFDF